MHRRIRLHANQSLDKQTLPPTVLQVVIQAQTIQVFLPAPQRREHSRCKHQKKYFLASKRWEPSRRAKRRNMPTNHSLLSGRRGPCCVSCPNSTGVRDPSSFVPGSPVGETAAALACLGSHVQWMPSASRRSATPQSFVHTQAEFANGQPKWNAQWRGSVTRRVLASASMRSPGSRTLMSVQRTAAALGQTRHVFSTQNNEVLPQDVLFWEKRSWLWTVRCAVSFLLQESPTLTLPKWTVSSCSTRGRTKRGRTLS